MSLEKTTYEDLKVPGLSFPVKGTSQMDTETQKMWAIFEVDGGRGKITVEFEDDHDVTVHTDQLAQVLYLALSMQTARLFEDTITQAKFNQIVQGMEGELE